MIVASAPLEAKVQKLQEALVGKDAEIETLRKTLKEAKASAASVVKQPDTESVRKLHRPVRK